MASSSLFSRVPATEPLLMGMIHLLPTPGSPGHQGIRKSLHQALEDARILIDTGFDGLLIENMHDFPPLREKDMGPEIASFISVIAHEIRQLAPAEMPVGLQVLFAAHQVAMAVSLAAGLDFIRAESWTYGHLSDKGWTEASAATTLRYASRIGATAKVWADVKKKHASHSATADLQLADILHTLELHGASAAIITGKSTGMPPEPEDLDEARRHTSLPLVLGSGLTVQNAPAFAGRADAFIVGTSIKKNGDWRQPVDASRARALREAVHG